MNDAWFPLVQRAERTLERNREWCLRERTGVASSCRRCESAWLYAGASLDRPRVRGVRHQDDQGTHQLLLPVLDSGGRHAASVRRPAQRCARCGGRERPRARRTSTSAWGVSSREGVSRWTPGSSRSSPTTSSIRPTEHAFTDSSLTRFGSTCQAKASPRMRFSPGSERGIDLSGTHSIRTSMGVLGATTGGCCWRPAASCSVLATSNRAPASRLCVPRRHRRPRTIGLPPPGRRSGTAGTGVRWAVPEPVPEQEPSGTGTRVAPARYAASGARNGAAGRRPRRQRASVGRIRRCAP